MSETTQQILKALEKWQQVQMVNPPSSKEWQAASKEIHRLAERLTGKKTQDARRGQ